MASPPCVAQQSGWQRQPLYFVCPAPAWGPMPPAGLLGFEFGFISVTDPVSYLWPPETTAAPLWLSWAAERPPFVTAPRVPHPAAQTAITAHTHAIRVHRAMLGRLTTCPAGSCRY